MVLQLGKFIPWLPALAAILCGICCTRKAWKPFAAPICIAGIGLAFLLSVIVAMGGGTSEGPRIVHFFDWIHAGDFSVNFSYYFDPLTILMLFVVTGIGTLVAIYAAGYMKGDKGYARFFMGVSLFIFSMTTLVMADNLVLLYLGWEGVGLCSYLLIGYYYEKPAAVAAAKKAFIVNRIGDLGFALGIFLTWQTFGTVEFAGIFEAIATTDLSNTPALTWIPFLLMIGAFGKSAQIPLYMWLPDAMEGPTPVSALIHAATMVTAGVYMIARLYALFELSPYALPLVAAVGGLTAIFAASIALCQYDIKRIFAYSTISQLGYMFLGLGVGSTFGAVFHLYTHAFFKALLFLTAGSVMHALAGQLDLRKMSGMREKMPWTGWLMFVGCLALAGVPPLSGFFSKDEILAATLAKGLDDQSPLFVTLAMVGLLTAFMTAYYTFRLWFRVFAGPTFYEMGDEHHAADDHGDAHGHGHGHDHGHDAPAAGHAHAHEPHEMPWLMNGPLCVLAIGAAFAGLLCGGWVTGVIDGSSAAGLHAGHDHEHEGVHVHGLMMVLSTLIALAGIATAAWFHLLNRPAADRFKAKWADLARLLEGKYFVDEVCDRLVVRPLKLLGHFCFLADRLIIDGIVLAVSMAPRLLGLSIQPSQRGVLQGYGLGMAMGVVVLLILVIAASGV